MADALRANLDQLSLQAGQSPKLDRIRQREAAHEVGKVIGKRVKLKANGVGSKILFLISEQSNKRSESYAYSGNAG